MPLALHYEVFRAGVPLVILPGLFGSTGNWRPMARRLAVKYRVLVVDLRNHGRSPHADSMRYEEMAEDVLMLLDKQGMARVALLGHSMGGKVAMTFALRYPDRVGALLVADVAPVRYGRHMDGLLAALLTLPVATLRDRTQADAALAQTVEDERLRQFLLQNLEREGTGFAGASTSGPSPRTWTRSWDFRPSTLVSRIRVRPAFSPAVFRAMSGPSTGMQSSRASRTRSS